MHNQDNISKIYFGSSFFGSSFAQDILNKILQANIFQSNSLHTYKITQPYFSPINYR